MSIKRIADYPRLLDKTPITVGQIPTRRRATLEAKPPKLRNIKDVQKWADQIHEKVLKTTDGGAPPPPPPPLPPPDTSTVIHVVKECPDGERIAGEVTRLAAQFTTFKKETKEWADRLYSALTDEAIAKLSEDNPRYVPVDGTRELTGNWDAGTARRITANTFAIHDAGTHDLIFDNVTNQSADYTLQFSITANTALAMSAQLSVTGSSSINQDVRTTASPTLVALTVGNVSVKSNAEVRWYDNGNYVGFEAPGLTADKIWVLPSLDGSSNQVLTTDGSGNLSWSTKGAGSTGDKFTTIACVAGSNPVADTETDTLTMTSTGSSVTITGNSGTDTVDFVVAEANVDHDALSNFVANEHIDHMGVTLTAGTGLSGGGTIAANRTFNLSHLGLESLSDPGADRIVFWDDGATALKWLVPDGTTIQISGTTLSVITGGVDHGGLIGLTHDDHPQYILHSLADAADDFLVASGNDVIVKKTLAETGAILEGDIVHDNLQGIPANDHIDWTGAGAAFSTSSTGLLGSYLTQGGGGVDGSLGITRYPSNISYPTTYRHKEEVSVSATPASNKWDFSLCDGSAAGFTSILRLRSTGIEVTGDMIAQGPIVDVRSYDAVGDGTNDDTAEIQAAIDAVATAGGTVFFPEGTYLISDTIAGKSGVALKGVKPSYVSSTKRGTWLKWGGSGAKGMLSLGTSSGGVQDIDVHNIGLDGQSDASVYAIDIQSNNSPATKTLSLKRLIILNPQIGINWGNGGTYQNDNIVIDHCRFISDPTSTMEKGIIINSANAGDFSEITNCAFLNINDIAIDLVKDGFIRIASCAAGGDANCKFINVNNIMNVLIESCQCEQMGYFLYFSGTASDSHGVTLISCVIDDPVELTNINKVVGIRNVWRSGGSLILNHGGAKYLGYGDSFEESTVTITNGEFTNIRETSSTIYMNMHAGEIFLDPIDQAGDNKKLGIICTTSGKRGSTWASGTAYSLNWPVHPTHTNWNGKIYEASVAGTSGGGEPNWATAPNLNDTVVDNTVTWTNKGDASKWSEVGQEFTTVTVTWDPANIANGAKTTVDVSVPWAALGDFAMASFSLDVQDLVLNAQVTAAHTVTAVLSNNTGAAVNLGSGTLAVRMFKQ